MTCLFSQPPQPPLAPLPVQPPFILKRFKDEELKLPAILVTPGLPNNQVDPNELSRLAPEVADAIATLSHDRSDSGSTGSGSKSHRTRSPHPWFIHSYTPDRRAVLGWPISSCGHSLEEKERFFAILKPDLHNFVIPLDSISREASPVHAFCPSQAALTYTNPQAAQSQANPIEGFVILQGEARFEVEHLIYCNPHSFPISSAYQMALEGYLRILHSEENETFDGRSDRDDGAHDRNEEAGRAQRQTVSELDEDDFSSDPGDAIDDAAFLAQLSPQAVKDFGPVFLYLARERDRDMLAATIESQERVAQFRAATADLDGQWDDPEAPTMPSTGVEDGEDLQADEDVV